MDKYTGAHDQIMTSLERMQRFVAALQRRGVEQEEVKARQERFKRVAEKRPARRWWQFWK